MKCYRERSIRFPKFRTKENPDSFERFLMGRVERTVEAGVLFLLILKLLARKPMAGSEVRKAISKAGFSSPHQTTLYTQLGVMRAMKLVEAEKGSGHRKVLRITEKGTAILERAESHLRKLIGKLELL